MLAVIFEVWPTPECGDDYFALAAQLKSDLEKIDGFISVERFQSLADAAKFLSLSFWRDESAVQSWRESECHRAAQSRGRHGLLRDYRLRVASVIRDYGLDVRTEAPVAKNTLYAQEP